MARNEAIAELVIRCPASNLRTLTIWVTTIWQRSPSKEETVPFLFSRRASLALTSMTGAHQRLCGDSLSNSLSRINDGRILSSNDNVDGVINAGAYMVANAAGIPNGAYNYGVLVVFKVPNGLTCLQVYVTDALEQKTYVRSRFNGASWRPWCLL